MANHLVALENGKIEMSDERSINPGAADFIIEMPRGIARQRPNNQQNSDDKQYELVQHIALSLLIPELKQWH